MQANVLLIDNYDSFVFNLSRYLQELGVETVVRRNDQITVNDVLAMNPSAIVLSPGPCTPSQAGICVELIQALQGSIPLLGVCLGHQAIGAAYGGQIVRAPEPVHGRVSEIDHNGEGLFADCPNPLRVARYHSLIVDDSSLPDCLTVTARTTDGLIMALAHRSLPVYGVQFHPESILTECGHQLLANFLQLAGIKCDRPHELQELPQVSSTQDDFYQREIDANVFRPL